ncbi:type II toxin-antitoxin system RelE/ParE family toxin [Aeromonas veronii]|uniref:type II toxin-antitoxin system RelE/ParE family toxin n=1 Tax=Aeromonas veronii TaxID=654 RepID=UPI001D0AA215|nr:type II toxin-antitoxin system RelE/ParE family toxin [Aeromonas veronii]MCC0091422.1 type II toxin-antitoxin system RelE/ParE family toxin [Aeromonas veronii]
MNSFSLGWEDAALDDRGAIYEFLVEFNLEAAERTDRLIEEAAESLMLQPHRHPACSDGNGRKMVLTKIPFILIYSVDTKMNCVRVMRVFHQAQKIPKLDH